MTVTRARIAERLRARPGPWEEILRSDADLDGSHLFPLPQRLRPAAVLVPLIERPEGLALLLTVRTAHLRHHAGQIAFPGGKVDAGETSADAALRETEEEIGLHRQHVSVLGRLDTYVTYSGFSITPWVGIVTPPFPLSPDASEVERAFEIPLDFVLDKKNHEIHAKMHEGKKRHYYAISWNGHFIWGATAGMLVNFHDIVTAQAGQGIASAEDCAL